MILLSVLIFHWILNKMSFIMLKFRKSFNFQNNY